jgi:hypothetical protein
LGSLQTYGNQISNVTGFIDPPFSAYFALLQVLQ